MQTVILSPSSLVKLTNQITMEDNRSENKDSCYFPGCRKDANCECEMCLASINATLDLMPMSAQRSTLTKLSGPKPVVDKTPVSIDPTLLSTPASRTPPVRVAPAPAAALQSTAQSVYPRKIEVKKKLLRVGMKFLRWVFLLGLIFGLEFGFSWGVYRALRPKLSGKMLRDVVEGSLGVKNFGERLILIQKGLEDYVDGDVSNCVLDDSAWKINQDGFILNSNCIMYRSPAEEVIIWGWPLQTGGLLTAGFSSRWFTALSGRLTEWPEGKIVYAVREANSTWILRKRSSSVVQFDPNTWVIEYKQSMFLENPKLFSAAVEFLELSMSKLIRKLKQEFWHLPDLGHYISSMSEADLSYPT